MLVVSSNIKGEPAVSEPLEVSSKAVLVDWRSGMSSCRTYFMVA